MNEHVALERRRDSLYRTEEEIAELVGVGIEKWRAIARVLERDGLPKRDALFCDRRYWPAVKAFLDRREGLGQHGRVAVDQRHKENWTS